MRHIEVMTARDIRRDYRVDPVEFQQHMNLSHNNTIEIEVLEDIVYRRKLRESHRNFRESLYDSIVDKWIMTPIELSYKDKIIHDGLHRLACALHINDDRLIAVKFNDLI